MPRPTTHKPFSRDALCTCHEPPMPVTLCSVAKIVTVQLAKYKARIAREAAEAQTTA